MTRSPETIVDLGGGQFKRTAARQAGALRLLRYAERGPVLGTPEAITVTVEGNTSALTAGNYDSGVPFSDATAYTYVGSDYSPGNVDFNNGGYLTLTQAPEFEFWTRTGRVEIWINGVQASGSPFQCTGDGLRRIAFAGGVAWRYIELRFTKAMSNMAGIIVRKPFTLHAVNAPWIGPKVAILGDSWCDAVGTSNLTNPGDGYGAKLGRLTGWNVYQVGFGGEGYTTSPGMLERVASIPADSKMVFVCAGINDNSSTAGVVGPAALAVWQAIRARCPDAFIVVNSPWRSPGRTPSQAIADAVRTTHATFKASDGWTGYVNSYDEGWFSGTGANYGGLQQRGDLVFTGPLAGVSSATLVSNWPNSSGVYSAAFYVDPATGSVLRTNVTVTNNSTAVSWTGGAVTASANAFAWKSTVGPSDLFFVDDLIHPGGQFGVNDGHMHAAVNLKNNTMPLLFAAAGVAV